MTRSFQEVERALYLHRSGLNQCQIARVLGIPRGTIREWIAPGYQRLRRPGCFRCDVVAPPNIDDYAYLLGLYLGDGYLTLGPRGVWRLRIFQDKRYVDLIERCATVIGAVSRTGVQRVPQVGCVAISSHWKHWIHVFPQHGPGPKHARAIALEPWQQMIVASRPRDFLAGLIHSDGCRSKNTIKHNRPNGTLRLYVYPRYQFTNASNDIRRLFTDTCDLLGVGWTQTKPRNVAVSRRVDVEFLDTFIGPKS